MQLPQHWGRTHTCVSHMDCEVPISYGPPGYTMWAGCNEWLFAEPLSTVTVKNPPGDFIPRDCGENF